MEETSDVGLDKIMGTPTVNQNGEGIEVVKPALRGVTYVKVWRESNLTGMAMQGQ